jgi:hypothetical protein
MDEGEQSVLASTGAEFTGAHNKAAGLGLGLEVLITSETLVTGRRQTTQGLPTMAAPHSLQ